MAEDKPRFLLLTQNPALTAQVKNALSDAVEVRDPSLLGPLLERGADLLVLDLSLPQRALQTVVSLLDAHRQVPLLVLAQGGAEEWYGLSHGNPLEAVIEEPLSTKELRRRAEELLEKAAYLDRHLVGRAESMQEVRDKILQLAPTPLSVLVTGESGTGKEVVAQALHHYSPRHDGPFRPLNCAAIPENLLENELFGHERGAFTDAKERHQGVFEQAEGGTVFLDEIGEMTLAAQLKLLRVLEEREVTRIGGNRSVPVDVRVIAATNKDLQQAVARGEFRRDLYHRLKVAELPLPPLRRRRRDVALLVRHYVDALNQRQRTAFGGFSAAAMELLEQYEWPGNVRELRNLVEHLVFAGPRTQVQPGDILPLLEEGRPAPADYLPVATNKTPDQSEREVILYALLELKRDMAELRNLVEERLSAPAPVVEAPFAQPARPILPVDGDIIAEEIEPETQEEQGARTLQELEESEIRKALAQVNGHREKAAELLGISVRTLFRKLDKYDLR